MADDETFLAQYEACTWPEADWHHREHIRLAYLYLRQMPFEAALARMRGSLQAYNTTHDVPDALTRGYHETMTVAWMQLVHVALQQYGPAETADAFLEAHSELLCKRALLFFYTRERIVSWEAKRSFLAPDLAPLPQFPSS
jgi:hypothetical protein